jgi:hypothetical protein
MQCDKAGLPMSQSGQTRSSGDVRFMSAVHPIAAKSRTSRHFGFGPFSDQAQRSEVALFDHLIGDS